MKKRISYIIILILFSAVAYMVYSTVGRVKYKIQADEKLGTLPDLPLFDMDSLSFDNLNLQTNILTIIIYFNSECEHCRYEAESITKNVEKFKKANLLWVSYEPISIMRQFATSYHLDDYPNIHFTKINHEDVVSTFGSVTIPHIFIYGKDRNLVKEYKGETKIEALLKWL